jgi:hypothetical protein
VKRWSLSARRRRRAAWVVSALLVVGIVSYLGFRFSNTGERIQDPFTNAPVRTVPKVPKSVRLSQAALRDVRSAADRFISSAVLRKHVDDSWDVTAPALRQGLTRAQWAKGEIPVVPYPARPDSIKWKLNYSYGSRVGFRVAFFRVKGSSLDADVFDIELSKSGAAGGQRWLVSFWAPAPGGVRPDPESPGTAPYESPRPLSTIWLLLPLALVAGSILVLVVVLVARGRIRRARAERDYRRRYEGAGTT